jgi:hypothetical protein
MGRRGLAPSNLGAGGTATIPPVDSLEDELASLPKEQRAELEGRLALRAAARRLAAKLQADEGDVFHILRNLTLTPAERLRRGLIHGRRRPRISHRG